VIIRNSIEVIDEKQNTYEYSVKKFSGVNCTPAGQRPSNIVKFIVHKSNVRSVNKSIILPKISNTNQIFI